MRTALNSQPKNILSPRPPIQPPIQPKSARGATALPKSAGPSAPPVYKAQPVLAALQKKESVAAPVTNKPGAQLTAPLRCARSVPRVLLYSRTVQRMLKRTDFWSETKDEVELTVKGYHRRHIISNHLMKAALQAWWNAHKSDNEGAKTSLRKLQETLDEMNNYQPNLIPGPGAENSAIGMFTNNAARKIEGFDSSTTPSDMQSSLGKYSGFQQGVQHQLIDPVLPTFTSDPIISKSPETARSFAVDLMDSTDFDWPPDADGALYNDWAAAYNLFQSLRAKAADFPYIGMAAVVRNFLSLKKPV